MEQSQHNNLLQRISSILLMNGGFLDNPGLFTGEMGIVLFISHYARFIQNELFSDLVIDLIERIQNNIHINTPNDYKYGLAGIGSAIEYLVQCEYFKADTDDILEDLDKRLFDLDNLPCLSVDEIIGVGYYALWRINGNSGRKQIILKTVLSQIVWFMEKKCQNQDFSYPTVDFIKEVVENANKITLPYFSKIPFSLKLCRKKTLHGMEENTFNLFMDQFSRKEFIIEKTYKLGLLNGLAGFGMALMTQIDGDDSWISLLPNDLIQKKDEPLPL